MIESIATSLRNNDSVVDSQSNFQEPCEEEATMSSVDNCDVKYQESKSSEKEGNTCGEISSVEMKGENGRVVQNDMKKDQLMALNKEKSVDRMASLVEGETNVGIKNKNSNDMTSNESEEVLDSFGEDKVPGCTECQINRCKPTSAELTMCLHAAVYKVECCALNTDLKYFYVCPHNII